MGGSTWVQDKTELFEGELVVFKRPNSPNWYMRVWIANEKKHFSQSLKTKSHFEAVERAKSKYKELQIKVARAEKVFTSSLGEAFIKYEEVIQKELLRGMIGDEWYKKQLQYLKNSFIHHFGEDKKVNDISDAQIAEYVDLRLKRCKRKDTIRQEIGIIKTFYDKVLIKNGYVYSKPEFPKFKIKKQDRARRQDTFTQEEMNKLFRFMIEEWCFRSTDERYSDPKKRIRYAIKEYGKKENKQKLMNDWEFDMELHRRHMMLYALFLLALTGMRAPSEIFSLTWGDISFRRKKYDNRNSLMQPMTIIDMSLMIEYSHHKAFKLLIWKIFEEWCCNDMGEMDISLISIPEDTKTGSRTVPCLCAGLFHQIQDYYHFMEAEIDGKLIAPPFDQDQPIFLEIFGRCKGQAFTKEAFNRLFRELMEQAGITRIKFTPYHFRHFFITERIRAGAKVPMIAKMVGNSPNEIYRTYEHIILEDDLEDLLQV
jgi:site-specific recombinase XerD